MKAMLFAAGLGTRLKPFTDNAPKALAEVNNKTLLEHNIRYLQRYGIDDIVVNVHHFAGMIEDVLAQNHGFGSFVDISDEREEVLETGGGLKKAAPLFAGEEDIVVMNVDVLTTLNLEALIASHKESGALATLAVMKRESSRHLLFDNDMQLCGWTSNKTGEIKTARDLTYAQPYAFSGIQVISSQLFNHIPFDGKFSMIDVYLHFAKNDAIKGYDHSGNVFIDVGKPESLQQAAYLFE